MRAVDEVGGDFGPSDVGLWGYPECPIRGFCLDDGETAGKGTACESLPAVNPCSKKLFVMALIISPPKQEDFNFKSLV